MKRVLFLNYEYPPLGGGAANATKYLLEEYSKIKKAKVDLVTSSVNNKFEKETIGENVNIYKLPIGNKRTTLNYQTKKELIIFTARAYFFARKLIKKNNYDLTHSFFAVPTGVLSYLFKRQYNLPYIVSLRGSDVPGYSERFAKMYRFLTPIIHLVWRNADYVVTNSQGLTKLAQKSLPKQKFLEIWNGVDTIFYQPNQRTVEDMKTNFRILLASRLSKRKGFKYAIAAFHFLVKKYPNISMIIAGGEGDSKVSLKKQVQKMNLQDKVRFTGAYLKKDSASIYNQADVFVMPSLNEGMSNNLLEALASGLPVLMTPTGGAKELVKNNKNGYIIKMNSIDSIIRKLELLIINPQLCKKFGKESRLLAEKMSWRKVAEEYLELYQSIDK